MTLVRLVRAARFDEGRAHAVYKAADAPAFAPPSDARPTGASESGRQLYALASTFPELADASASTGLYQALGREKVAVYDAVHARILEDGDFDGLKPVSVILEYQPYGAFSSLALAFACRGPCYAIEGDEIAGLLACEQACIDLARGRTERALVGGYVTAESAWLLLLDAAPGASLRGALRAGRLVDEANLLADVQDELDARVRVVRAGERDAHAFAALVEALGAAQGGKPAAAVASTPDGRVAVLGARSDTAQSDGS